MSDPFMGQIQPVAFNFPPVDWMTCAGQSMQVRQYNALFSLLGTMYGGDGAATFFLPDLQGRTMLGAGVGIPHNNSYLSGNFTQGVYTGNQTQTLNVAQLPPHTHGVTGSVTLAGLTATLKATDDVAASTLSAPANGSVLAPAGTSGIDAVTVYAPAGTATNVTLGGLTLSGSATVGGLTATATGGGGAFSLMQPSVIVNMIISIAGLYPTRQ